MSKKRIRVSWILIISFIWLIGILPGRPYFETMFPLVFITTIIWAIYSVIKNHGFDIIICIFLMLTWGMLMGKGAEKFTGWTGAILGVALIYTFAKKEPEETTEKPKLEDSQTNTDDTPKRKEIYMMPGNTGSFPYQQTFPLFTNPTASHLPSIPESAEAALAKNDPERACEVLMEQAKTEKEKERIRLMKESIIKMMKERPDAKGIEVASGTRPIRVGVFGKRWEFYIQIRLIT